MTWVRLDDAMPDHPKIDGLTDRAFRWLIRSWCHAARYHTDGHLPASYTKRVPPRVRDELLDAGLWHQNGSNGLEVHDFLAYNPSQETIAEARRKKAEAGRLGGLAKQANAKANA